MLSNGRIMLQRVRRKETLKRVERSLQANGSRTEPRRITNDTVSENRPLAGTGVALKHSGHQPRTELGRKLWEIRSQIIASGIPLLDWEGIEREIAAMRDDAEAGDE